MDSDSDNSNTAAQRKRVAIDTLDSDSSDDDLLEQMKPTFGRKRRSKETYKTKADRILNQAMKSSQKDMEQQRLISKIKKEEIDEEDLIANAARLREEESKFPKSRQETRALVEGTLSIEGGGAEHDSWERQLALAEAADTQNTCSLGSRATISTAKEHPIPATRYQALEYLQHILDETTANQLSPSIRNVLTNNLRKQTIHSFLLNKQLGTLDHSTTLPKPLLHWFFLIACSSSVDNNQAGGTEDDSLESLACGCYLTLTKMWTEFKGFPEKGFLLRLADLPDQLEAWFGLSGKRADLQPPQKETTLPSTRSEIAICRFLRLWDVAFSQKMVYIADADDDDDNSAKDVLPQATKCISGLLLTGMNKCFESKKT